MDKRTYCRNVLFGSKTELVFIFIVLHHFLLLKLLVVSKVVFQFSQVIIERIIQRSLRKVVNCR